MRRVSAQERHSTRRRGRSEFGGPDLEVESERLLSGGGRRLRDDVRDARCHRSDGESVGLSRPAGSSISSTVTNLMLQSITYR
jgi:hypothetical protein